MNQTKIDWASATWNPVTGCLGPDGNGLCPYCYAHDIAHRFDTFEKNANLYSTEQHKWYREKDYAGLKIPIPLTVVDEPIRYITKEYCQGGVIHPGKEMVSAYPFGFAPTFHRYRLNEPEQRRKRQNIFVGSMTDLFGEWVPDSWIKDVFESCGKAPWHRFMFLTKNAIRYEKLINNGLLSKGDNMWYGVTITHNDDLKCIGSLPLSYGNRFLSIEPILEAIDLDPLGIYDDEDNDRLC